MIRSKLNFVDPRVIDRGTISHQRHFEKEYIGYIINVEFYLLCAPDDGHGIPTELGTRNIYPYVSSLFEHRKETVLQFRDKRRTNGTRGH